MSDPVEDSPALLSAVAVQVSIATVRVTWPIALGGTTATARLLAPHITNNAFNLPAGFLISTMLAAIVTAAISGNIGGRILAHASTNRW